MGTHEPVITLGTTRITVAPIPLGRLKHLVPRFGDIGARINAGLFDAATMDGIIGLLVEGTGLPAEQIEAMPATVPQLADAVAVIASVCGLAPQEPTPGEAPPAVAVPSTGTTSTAG